MVMFKKKKTKTPRVEFTEDDYDLSDEEDLESEDDDEVPEIQEKVVKKPKVDEVKPLWSVQEIPTQSQRVIVDSKGNVYDLHSAIAEILNRTEEE